MKLKALILTGGHSTRMGQDKASLSYHGIAQRDYLLNIFNQLSLDSYLSIRPDQKQEEGTNYIVDQQTNIGPMAALLAAFEHDECPWLMIGCDYPFMGMDEIKRLLEARSIQHSATAAYQTENGILNPTIAIYEPKILPLLKSNFAAGQYSLRKLLQQADVARHTEIGAAFVSADTQEDYQKVKNKLSNGGAIHP